MNAIRFGLFASLFALGNSLAQVEEGPTLSLEGARVTLPYSEVLQLLEAARSKETEPAESPLPVSALVRSLVMNLEVLEDSIRVQAEIAVEAFGEDWQVIDLLGIDASLVKVEPAEARVIRREGVFALLQNGPGESTLKLTFESPRRRVAREQLLTLDPLEATVRRMQISGIPPNRAVELNGVAQAGGESVSMTLSADSGDVEIALMAAQMQAEAAAPSSWNLSAQIVVRYEDGSLVYDGRLFARDETGDGTSLRLRLPNHAREILVSGDGLAATRAGQGIQQLSWADAGVVDRRVEFSFRTPISPLAENWTLAVPRPEMDSSEVEALFVIPSGEGLEISGEGVVAAADSQRISDWFHERLKGADFVSVQTPNDVDVQPRWLPRRATAQATISQATFETQLEKNGQTLNQASYYIEHENLLVWQLQLPEDCEILRCSVNGRQVAPTERDETTIEFHLTPSGEDEEASTEVRVDYAHRADPLDEIEGDVRLTLPKTPLFVHEAAWSLRIPDAYVVTAVDGNLEVASSSAEHSGNANTLSLVKRLLQAEAPEIDLFYSRPTATD
ncbi:MAG: hypothetical protein ACI8UO_003304 [Verrucomicrobiales bacterium]|jgi:hypothetical protein